MVASPPLTTMRARLLMGALLACAGTAARAAPVNSIQRLTVRDEGATTVVAIRGTATPTFTAYKLERPERVVIDVAGSRLENELEPMTVSSWSVSQVSVQAMGGQEAAVVRVLVGFARPSQFRVRAIGNDVVVTVIADEARPAVDAKARAEAEEARARAEAKWREAERMVAEAEARARAAEASGASGSAQLRKQAEEAAARRAQAEQAVTAAERRRAAVDEAAAAAERRRAEAERLATEAEARARAAQAAGAES